MRLRADFAHGFPEDQAKRMLGELRRKRRFRTMGRLAEALILAGIRLPRIRRQFAQALIDQDHFAASEFLLQSILDEDPGSATEKDEAKGLLGRIYKQWHLSPGNELAESGPTYLVKSFEIYSQAFDADARNYWHGINACALAARARRYGIALPGDPNPHTMAGDVLDSLKKHEDEHPNGVPAFAIATAVEAYLALGSLDQALAKLGEYIRCKDADAFEFASTLRNLVQVWELTVDVGSRRDAAAGSARGAAATRRRRGVDGDCPERAGCGHENHRKTQDASKRSLAIPATNWSAGTSAA